jgi:hypothetical protein
MGIISTMRKRFFGALQYFLSHHIVLEQNIILRNDIVLVTSVNFIVSSINQSKRILNRVIFKKNTDRTITVLYNILSPLLNSIISHVY